MQGGSFVASYFHWFKLLQCALVSECSVTWKRSLVKVQKNSMYLNVDHILISRVVPTWQLDEEESLVYCSLNLGLFRSSEAGVRSVK